MVVTGSLLIEIALMIFYFIQYGIFTKNEAIMTYENIAYQTMEQFTNTRQEIENIAYQVSYSGSIQKYLKEEQKSEKYKMLDLVEDNLDYLLAANLNVSDICVYGNDGGIISSSLSNSLLSGFEKDAYKRINSLLSSNEINGFFSEFYYDVNKKRAGFSFYYPIYFSDDRRGKIEPAGVCIMHCQTTSLQNSVKSITLTEGMKCWVLDEENMILASNEVEDIGRNYEKIYEMKTEDPYAERVITQEGKKYQVVQINGEGLTIIYQIPYQSFMSNIPKTLVSIFLAICIFAVILIVVVVIILQNITMPISLIVNEMREISLLGKRKRLSVVCNNEIGEITKEVNLMLERIENLNEIRIKNANELMENKLLQKQAELLFLRSQINPHFLYNSLECIRGMALACNVPQIVSITASLIKLLRYTLSTHVSVSMKEELRSVMEYCNVMSIRFQKNFTYRIDVPSELMDVKVMPMLLQPLVENSFKHGFKSGKGSLIKIDASIEKEFLVISVKDDGKGMNPEAVHQMNEKLHNSIVIAEQEDSIGLSNVQRRIKMQYGEECGLFVECNEMGGVTVSAKIRKEMLM